MLKLLATLVLVATSFGLGFYLGQRPVGTLQHTVSDLQRSITNLSRNVYDTTKDVERNLRKRQALLDSKSRLVQAKAELFEKNFGEATKQLGEATEMLESATQGAKQDETTSALKSLAGKFREVRLELSMGKTASVKKLNEIQREIDQQLNQ